MEATDQVSIHSFTPFHPTTYVHMYPFYIFYPLHPIVICHCNHNCLFTSQTFVRYPIQFPSNYSARNTDFTNFFRHSDIPILLPDLQFT